MVAVRVTSVQEKSKSIGKMRGALLLLRSRNLPLKRQALYTLILLFFSPTNQPHNTPHTRLITIPHTHPALTYFTTFILVYFLLPRLLFLSRIQDLVQSAIFQCVPNLYSFPSRSHSFKIFYF